jgi:hypothetical protein
LHGDGVESEFQRNWERLSGEKKLVGGWVGRRRDGIQEAIFQP